VTSLLRAELVKLRTTRAFYGYLTVLVALSAIGAAAQASEAHLLELEDPSFQRDLLSQSVAAPLIALLLGIVSLTVEWRHGTITRTFLVSPRRWRVLAAKEINAFVLGVGLAILGLVVAIAVAAPVLSHDGTPLQVDGALVVRAAEIMLAAALWGALGAGAGALIQHQAAALVGAILWILVIESLLVALVEWADLGWIADALPRHALDALAGNEEGLSAGAGGAIGFAYVVVFAGFALVRIRRQDIT
jgi:ABC-2 type transport system permease protein